MHPVSDLKIAIAGAGLMGRLLAWRLLKQGAQVSLFERDRFDAPTSAAHTAAAMISPLSEVVVSERAIYDMGIRSLQLWPNWVSELEQDILPSAHNPAAINYQSSINYQNNGSLVVAHPADMSELEQFQRELAFHLGSDNTARWMEGEALRSLEPCLSEQFQAGLLLPNEAYLDNRNLLDTLLINIERLGGKLLEQQKIAFNPNPNVNGKALNDFDLFIDCRGLGAKLDQSSSKQNLRGVRGEVLWVETDEVKFQRPIRLMHPRYKLYIVPKPNNRFIIGATEIESEDRSPVSVQSMMELCSALYTLNPAFAEARIHELDANLRPSFLNNLPEINHSTITTEDAQSRPLIQVNGLYRHGYLLAPYLTEKTEQMIAKLNAQVSLV